MARITVEDCIDKVPNRFDLVLLAAHRARDISLGAELTVDRDKDKNPVVALREIADETLTAEQIRESRWTAWDLAVVVSPFHIVRQCWAPVWNLSTAQLLCPALGQKL